MLEDIKNKINDNAKEIGKEINNSASAVSKIAKNKIDSVVLNLATQIVTKSMNGLASKAAAPGIGDEAPTATCPKPSKFLAMALIRISSSNTGDIDFYSAASALVT